MNAEGKEKLIEVIKRARGSMSQRAFGKMLGVSATAVQLWEKGQTIPDTENLAQIARRAGFTMEELFCYLEGKPLPEPVDLTVMLKQIQCMPISQVAVIVRAGVDRMATAAESSDDEIKAS
ncbi:MULTISPECIES: helix-turn-helix transcriptional regulator [Aerosakkonema]|uniref:helix-turn-helix transcriptional regulator n=1 Tax=Aerosakkonema TaxID=1246629 RepID=UPI0035BB4B9B